MLEALKPDLILGAAGVGLALYGLLSWLQFPVVFFYGLIGGIGQPLHVGLPMLFGALGLVLLWIGMLIGAYLALQLLVHGYFHLDRPFTVLLLLCILAGLQMLGFGFIGTQIVLLRRELYRLQRMVRTRREDS